MLKKVDFHVHTPASQCYLDHTVTGRSPTLPGDIARAAVACGLDAIVLVDHNTAEGIDPVREAAEGQGVAVFPGIEVSARGGHLLSVFEPGTPVTELRRVVSALGFTPQQAGLGYEESPLWIDQAFQVVAEAGGIAIAAHIDRRPRGFAVSGELRWEEKRRIHNSPHLSALEITIPFDKPLWNRGQMPGFSRPLACLQGSDAHAPEEIGRRPVFLAADRLDLAGIRAAFNHTETGVKFPSEVGAAQPP